jgi:hypothetical protein
LNASGYGDLYVEESRGNLNSDFMMSQTGLIDLFVPDGSADIDHISAPGTVSIQANGPFISVRLIDPAVLDLRDPFPGAVISVDQAFVSESVTVWADTVQLGEISHTGDGTLHFDVRGGSKPMADLVEIGTNSDTSIDFDHLSADKATIKADVYTLSFFDTSVGSRADFSNSLYHAIVDNGNRKPQPSSLQLFATSPFSLQFFADKRFETSAFVINYDPDFIVNGFSTDNSMVGANQKMLWTGKRQDRLYYDPLEPGPHPWQRAITPSGREVIDAQPGAVGIGGDDARLKMGNVDVISR